MPLMPGAPAWGRLLIVAGLILVAAGLVLSFAPRLPWLGNLPGDISIRRGNFTFHFPLTTCLLISLLLTLLLYVLRR